MPLFSFIIPVKPNAVITALTCLHHLEQPCMYEILVVEGTNPSRQRNVAAQEAKGDIIYFLDDDSRVLPGQLATCISAFNIPEVAVVGGPSLTPDSDSNIQKLFGAALASPFGAGSMCNRYKATGRARNTTDRELILCNMAIRREVFLNMGGFDERLYPNEENELLDRIHDSGMKLMHLPDMSVMRSQRQNLYQFLRQMFSYGRGRAQQTLIAGSASPVSYAPLALLIYLLILPFTYCSYLFMLPLVLYAILNAYFTLSILMTSRIPFNALLAFIFPLMHISNGIGLAFGFVRGKQGKASSTSSAIIVTKVKRFDQREW